MNAALEIDPSWLRVDNIERRAGLTPDEFVAQYETTGIPVVLTDVMDSWRAKSEWTPAQLRNKYGDVKFRVSAMMVCAGQSRSRAVACVVVSHECVLSPGVAHACGAASVCLVS